MKKRYLSQGLYIIFIFFCISSQAQSPEHPAMPKLTPLSPEAAAMGRYGEYPVSMFTGIPDISIPLFEVTSTKFKVPITLRYHASGNKVGDYAGWIGLGWSLDAGGRISRKVMGKDDQSYTRYVRSSDSIDPQNTTDHLYLKSVFEGTTVYDTDPDIYNFNFPGKSGRFIFKDTLTPLMIPYCGVKVAGIHSPNKLTDEIGNIYYFNYSDNPSTDYPNKTSGTDPISSWLLTKMVSAGRTDSIEFNYQSLGTGVLGKDYVDYVTVDDNVTYQGCGDHKYYSNTGQTGYNYWITTNGSELVPSQINSSEEIVKFIPTTYNRLDRSSDNFKSIDRIKIYSKKDTITPIKTIVFYQSYFDNGTDKRLRLDSLRILDENENLIQRYSIGYNTEINLPAIASNSKDFWGYYNGKSNSMLLPRMTVAFIGDNYSSNTDITIGSTTINGRDPDPSYNQAYILNRITYPTGGYTTFEYETNKYLDGENSKYAGGLRITKIKSYNENGICSIKTYKYGENESGYGRFNVFMSDFYYSTPDVFFQCRNYYNSCGWTDPMQIKRSRTFTSNPCQELNPYDGSPVVYATVTEYAGDETNNIGKTIYKFKDDDHDMLGSFVTVDKSFKINKSFRRGLLSSKKVYKKEGDAYIKVSALGNSYFYYSTNNDYLSLRVAQKKHYECDIYEVDYEDYAWCNVPVFYGDNLLTSTDEFSYDVNDTSKYVLKSTNYNYNSPLYTQVSDLTTSLSTGEELTNFYKYSTDDSTGYYPQMNSLNIIGLPIREYQIINQTDSIFSKRTNFNKYHDRFFAPSSIDFKTGTNPWEKRIIYSSYDESGNLLSVKKDIDIPISYTYNMYNQPIAEIANADTNSFYFNDFENTDGNSNTDDCKTGRKSRTGGFSKALSGLQSGTYILSWWSKSAGIWGSNSNPVSIGSSYTISLSGQVDDVRLFINTATMKTYTYDPLIGITSMTDQNNIITYYEYDPFGRLKYIKDENSNILKSYDYHYKSQAYNP